MLIDTVADSLSINVLTFALGPNAEHGWELEAFTEAGDQRWTVRADTLYDAAGALAEQVGFEVEDG